MFTRKLESRGAVPGDGEGDTRFGGGQAQLAPAPTRGSPPLSRHGLPCHDMASSITTWPSPSRYSLPLSQYSPPLSRGCPPLSRGCPPHHNVSCYHATAFPCRDTALPYCNVALPYHDTACPIAMRPSSSQYSPPHRNTALPYHAGDIPYHDMALPYCDMALPHHDTASSIATEPSFITMVPFPIATWSSSIAMVPSLSRQPPDRRRGS